VGVGFVFKQKLFFFFFKCDIYSLCYKISIIKSHINSQIQEKRLIQKWFDEIATDTGKYCFMIKDTLNALEVGAVETLIVWDQLDADM
jgi:hypothetical protein